MYAPEIRQVRFCCYVSFPKGAGERKGRRNYLPVGLPSKSSASPQYVRRPSAGCFGRPDTSRTVMPAQAGRASRKAAACPRPGQRRPEGARRIHHRPQPAGADRLRGGGRGAGTAGGGEGGPHPNGPSERETRSGARRREAAMRRGEGLEPLGPVSPLRPPAEAVPDTRHASASSPSVGAAVPPPRPAATRGEAGRRRAPQESP